MRKNVSAIHQFSRICSPVSHRKKTKKLTDHRKHVSSITHQNSRKMGGGKGMRHQKSYEDSNDSERDPKNYVKSRKFNLCGTKMKNSSLLQIDSNIQDIKKFMKQKCHKSELYEEVEPISPSDYEVMSSQINLRGLLKNKLKQQNQKKHNKKTIESVNKETQPSQVVSILKSITTDATSLQRQNQYLKNLVEMLDFQKEYLRQKVTFLQVQNRELNTKIEEMGNTVGPLQLTKTQSLLHYSPSNQTNELKNCSFNKKEPVGEGRSQRKPIEIRQNSNKNSLIILGSNSKKSSKCGMNSHLASISSQISRQRTEPMKQNTQSNTDKLSSLLISLSNTNRNKCDLSHKNNLSEFTHSSRIHQYIQNIENDFSKLLQYINKETSEQRKYILRNMLALKAKVLKKYSLL